MPALEFYKENDNRRNLWMQARCHYLMGALQFGENHVSEKAAKNLVEALKILDNYFKPDNTTISCLYSKLYSSLASLAFNHNDEPLCKMAAQEALAYAKMANDTACILNSYGNLISFWELFGRTGQEQESYTTYLYYKDGWQYVDIERYPFKTAFYFAKSGDYFRHSNDYENAIKYFERVKTLVDSTTYLSHYAYLHEALVYYRLADYTSAVANLNISYQSKSEDIRNLSAQCIANCYEKMGDSIKAAPYNSKVKTHSQKINNSERNNSKAMPIIRDYLNDKNTSHIKVNFWLFAVFGIAIAVAFILLFRWNKRRFRKVELETLLLKSKTIYNDKQDEKSKRIFAEFNSVFPDVIEKLAKTYPDLTETEKQIAILTFLKFRTKEQAVILNYSENTIMKYRSVIKKKAGSEPIMTVIDK